jgi:excisionase family DNA binding protein
MITTEQAADKWGVARRTVRSWIERGKLPTAQKMGRDWVIPADTPKPADRRYVKNPVRNRRKTAPPG